MNAPAIFRYAAFGLGAIALACLIPMLVALFLGEWDQAQALAGTVFAGAFITALIGVLVPKSVRKVAPRDALVALVIWWLTSPVLLLPIFMVGVPNNSLIAGYFEAVSNLTTTGTTQTTAGLYTMEAIPASLFVARAVGHLFGATVSLAALLTVLPALNFGGTGLQRTRLFSGIDNGIQEIFLKSFRLAGAYLTVFWAGLGTILLLTGLDASRAYTLAMSVVTTGLVDPAADLQTQGSKLTQLVVAFGLVLSAFNIVTVLAIRSWPGRLLKDTEALAVIFIVLAAGALVTWQGALEPGLRGFVWAASHVSTSGVMTEPLSTGLGDSVVFLSCMLVFMGGAALSTSGGVKLSRILILSERARLEFKRLGFQNAVAPFVFRGAVKRDVTVVGVWIYIIAYTIGGIGLCVILSIEGRAFPDAFVASMGLLSNAGNLVPDDFSLVQKPAACLAMILGRFEILAIAPMFARGFWRL